MWVPALILANALCRKFLCLWQHTANLQTAKVFHSDDVDGDDDAQYANANGVGEVANEHLVPRSV